MQVDVATVIAKPIAEWQNYSGRMEAVEKVDNLGYTQVVAPVSGRISRAELMLGNVLSTGASAPILTTLVSVSPMYASFR